MALNDGEGWGDSPIGLKGDVLDIVVALAVAAAVVLIPLFVWGPF